MGSEDWQTTADDIKAAAYQIATKIGGWDEARLKEVSKDRAMPAKAAWSTTAG
jgi:hypothetical protein